MGGLRLAYATHRRQRRCPPFWARSPPARKVEDRPHAIVLDTLMGKGVATFEQREKNQFYSRGRGGVERRPAATGGKERYEPQAAKLPPRGVAGNILASEITGAATPYCFGAIWPCPGARGGE